MMRPEPLRYRDIVMHWGDRYPHINDVWLAYFKDDPSLYVCRVEGTDELGGNLVELTLHRAKAADPRRWRDVVQFNFHNNDQCTITSWEPLTRITRNEWYTFLDKDIASPARRILWQMTDARLTGA